MEPFPKEYVCPRVKQIPELETEAGNFGSIKITKDGRFLPQKNRAQIYNSILNEEDRLPLFCQSLPGAPLPGFGSSIPFAAPEAGRILEEEVVNGLFDTKRVLTSISTRWKFMRHSYETQFESLWWSMADDDDPRKIDKFGPTIQPYGPTINDISNIVSREKPLERGNILCSRIDDEESSRTRVLELAYPVSMDGKSDMIQIKKFNFSTGLSESVPAFDFSPVKIDDYRLDSDQKIMSLEFTQQNDLLIRRDKDISLLQLNFTSKETTVFDRKSKFLVQNPHLNYEFLCVDKNGSIFLVDMESQSDNIEIPAPSTSNTKESRLLSASWSDHPRIPIVLSKNGVYFCDSRSQDPFSLFWQPKEAPAHFPSILSDAPVSIQNMDPQFCGSRYHIVVTDASLLVFDERDTQEPILRCRHCLSPSPSLVWCGPSCSQDQTIQPVFLVARDWADIQCHWLEIVNGDSLCTYQLPTRLRNSIESVGWMQYGNPHLSLLSKSLRRRLKVHTEGITSFYDSQNKAFHLMRISTAGDLFHDFISKCRPDYWSNELEDTKIWRKRAKLLSKFKRSLGDGTEDLSLPGGQPDTWDLRGKAQIGLKNLEENELRNIDRNCDIEFRLQEGPGELPEFVEYCLEERRAMTAGSTGETLTPYLASFWDE